MNTEKMKDLKARVSETIPEGTTPRIRERIKNSVVEAAQEWLSGEEAQKTISDGLSQIAASLGIDLVLTDLQSKEAIRADFDLAITKKLNELVGTTFESLRAINRESVQVEAGRMIGEQLGVGPIWPVERFRQTMGDELVASFDGGGQLIGSNVADLVEQKMLKQWREPTPKAGEFGNLSARFGPPRDAAHAAQRAANRERQARYRKKNALVWVALGFAAKEGNGREGLSGKAAGNAKTVRNGLRSEDYNYRRDL